MTTPHPDPELLDDVTANFPWDAAQRLVGDVHQSDGLTPAQRKRARKRANRQTGSVVTATPRPAPRRNRREVEQAVLRVRARRLGIHVAPDPATMSPVELLRAAVRIQLRRGLARLLGRQP